MSNVKFIPSLTPLRGIAAVLVVYFHCDIFLGSLMGSDYFIISKLYLMVDLFFVLSGFIMAHVYGKKFFGKLTLKHFFDFMKARFARLYPLHLFTFAYLFVWINYLKSQIEFDKIPVVMQGVFDNTAIPGVLTLTHAWGSHLEATWNTASWSISVEWFLYLIFPLIIWFISKYKKIALPVLAISSIAFLFLICYQLEPIWLEKILEYRNMTTEMTDGRPKNSVDILTGFSLLRGFCGFVLGIIAYELYKRNIGKSILKSGYYFASIWILLFAVWYKDILPDPFNLIIFAILILHIAYVEGSVKKILNSRVLTYLGDISYSIYMVHIPLILTFFLINLLSGTEPDFSPDINFLKNWITATIFLLVVIGVASLSYFFIEKPARKALRKLMNKKKE